MKHKVSICKLYRSDNNKYHVYVILGLPGNAYRPISLNHFNLKKGANRLVNTHGTDEKQYNGVVDGAKHVKER